MYKRQVKGLSLDVILGNDFLERNKAVIDFNKRIVEFNNGSEPVRVNFKRVTDEIKVMGIKIIQKRVGDGDIETRVNICRESEIGENEEREVYASDERIWERWADKFFNEGGVVGSPQRQAWAVDVYKRQDLDGTTSMQLTLTCSITRYHTRFSLIKILLTVRCLHCITF